MLPFGLGQYPIADVIQLFPAIKTDRVLNEAVATRTTIYVLATICIYIY